MSFFDSLLSLFSKTEPTPAQAPVVATKDRRTAPRRPDVDRRASSKQIKRNIDFKNIPKVPDSIVGKVVWDSGFRHIEFGNIAIVNGYISQQSVDEVLAEKPADQYFGEFCLKKGLMTHEQVTECLKKQRLTIYVDELAYSGSAFMTWMTDCRNLGYQFQYERCNQRLMARHVEEFTINEETQIGLEFLNRAKNLITQCALMESSDIHIVVRERFCEIQVRVKGDLKTVELTSKIEGETLIRAIYTGVSTIKEPMYKPYDRQDAQISGDVLPGSGLTSVRIIRGPCYPVDQGGQFMVMRLQYGLRKKDSSIQVTLKKSIPAIPDGDMKLERMGYTTLQIGLLENMMRLSSGMILITGPTGSGKTTTLYEMMMHQARKYPEMRQVTVEDPVEYPMSWAIQMVVKACDTEAETQAEFVKAGKATLRMDPDIILYGELRGPESAKTAIQAAMTGHLAYSTVHVTDPYMAVERLEGMDRRELSRDIICKPEIMRGLVSQRLAKTLCQHCAITVNADNAAEFIPEYGNIFELGKAWIKEFHERKDAVFDEITEPVIKVRGSGCSHCDFDAIAGKTTVAEVVTTSKKLMNDIIKHGIDHARTAHRQTKGADMSMLGNVMRLVCRGLVSPRDAENAVDILVLPSEE